MNITLVTKCYLDFFFFFSFSISKNIINKQIRIDAKFTSNISTSSVAAATATTATILNLYVNLIWLTRIEKRPKSRKAKITKVNIQMTRLKSIFYAFNQHPTLTLPVQCSMVFHISIRCLFFLISLKIL